MTELVSKRLYLANFGFFVVLELFVWVSGLGAGIPETARIWAGLILVLDLFLLINRLVNHRFEVYRYLAVAVVVVVADVFSIKISSLGFLFDVGLLSYLLACVVLKGLCQALHHRFSLSLSEWEVLFQPKNFLFTLVLLGVTVALTVAFGVTFTKV